jgi:tetratricopeptide (TPR) repeat protein
MFTSGRWFGVLRVPCLLFLVVGRVHSQGLAEYDFDRAINATEKALERGNAGSNIWKQGAQAYYLKGMLLLTAYDANADLSRIHLVCREKEIPSGKGGYYWLARAWNAVADDSIKAAIEFLKKSQNLRKESYWNTIGTIWLGALYARTGNTDLRDTEWRKVDWSAGQNESEKRAVSSVLGIDGSRPEGRRDGESSGARDARNRILMSGDLKQIDREERVRLLGALDINKPVISRNDRSFTEVYYDIFALLAGARCALSIARDMMMGIRKEESSRSDIGIYIGLSAFLLGDDGTILEVLKDDRHKSAPVLLGAAHFRSGSGARAIDLWKQAEGASDPDVLSLLGYVYAVLGHEQGKARQFCSQATARGDQADWGRLGFVLSKQNQPDLAYEAFNLGYRHSRRNEMSVGANDPSFTVAFCAAAQVVDATHMSEVNEMLLVAREKYPFLTPLHEASVGISACRSIIIGN